MAVIDQSTLYASNSSFGEPGLPYVGQTFTALAGGLSSVEFWLTGSTQNVDAVEYRLLITTWISNESTGFHPGSVLFESPLLSQSSTGSREHITVSIGNLSLVEGQQYAFILDARSAFDGAAGRALWDVSYVSYGFESAGTNYTGGYSIMSGANSPDRDVNFAAGWTSFINEDMRFRMTFNAAPVVTTSDGPATPAQEQVATVIDSGLTLSDSDSTTFASARVSISNYVLGEDQLVFANDPGTMGNIDAAFDLDHGVLELTSSGATATIEQWQAALRAVSYLDTSDRPNTGERTVTFAVNDGITDSAVATRIVNVVPVDDHPMVQFLPSIPIAKIGQTVTFAASVNDPDGASYSIYDWNFGDGQHGSAQTEQHSYTTPGYYNVVLNYTDPTGIYPVFGSIFVQDNSPTANAGGPYQMIAGGNLKLFGSGTDPDVAYGDRLTFAWDLDGDKEYDDAVSANAILQWSDLQALSLTSGTHTIALKVSDSYGQSHVATTTLTIKEGPTANADTVAIDEDTPTTIDAATLLGNDTDLAGGALEIIEVGLAKFGSVKLVNGNPVFTPEGDFTGQTGFQYTIRNSDGVTSTATVTVIVNGVNDAPGARGLSGDLLLTEDAPAAALYADVPGIFDNDSNSVTATLTLSDAAAGVLTGATATGTPGVYTLSGSPKAVAFALMDVKFDSADDYNGKLSIAVAIDDGATEGPQGTNPTGTIFINVTPENDAPEVSGAVTLAAVNADSGARVIKQAELLANARDIDGPSLTAIDLAILSGDGTLVANGDDTWSYTPTAGDTSEVTFSYKVSDGSASADATASLDIVPVQQNPEPPPPPPAPAMTIGTPNKDSFAAPAGDHYFVGLGDIDTVTFGFKLTDATVTYAGNKIVIDTATSHTVLNGIERFVFTDGTVDNNDGDWLVDDLFYYSHNHDVWNAKSDADAHFHTFGWHEDRDPNAFFDTSGYLERNGDVAAAGVDPLVHFNQFGWKEGRAPSAEFGLKVYLSAYSDVKAAGVNPLAHFLQNGAGEGREPLKPIANNGFDFAYYLQNNPDVDASGVDPLQHFAQIGWTEFRNPNALFDTKGYLTAYGDVATSGVNPLDHYHQSGWQEGRDPSLAFDTASYLAANADVKASGADPLQHFLAFGLAEHRPVFADTAWG